MASRPIILLAIASAMMTPTDSAGAAAGPTDVAVKAAFLPRFARYVTWPSAAIPKGSDPFVLCVIGSDPFGATLDEAARSQSIDGRRIVIRRLNNAAAANDCQIAFAAGRSAQLLASLEGKPVLTVTDGANGAARGIINFAIVGGRVRFYIDQAAAARRGMNVSSRLLALAIGVKQ